MQINSLSSISTWASRQQRYIHWSKFLKTTVEIQLVTAIAYGPASLNVISVRCIWIIFKYWVGQNCVKYPLFQTFTNGKMFLSYSHLTWEKCALTLSDRASQSLSLSLCLVWISLMGVQSWSIICMQNCSWKCMAHYFLSPYVPPWHSS
jgi:hypothetical protein